MERWQWPTQCSRNNVDVSLALYLSLETAFIMLKVWFYDPKNDEEGLFNRAVAYSDPPYCHCELQFPDTMTCSIYMGSTVCFKKRANFGESYTLVSIPASRDQIDAAYQMCQQNYDAKQQFSTLEMLTHFSAWRYGNSQSQYTYCSKLVAEALQAAQIIPKDTSCHMSPSALYRKINAIIALKRNFPPTTTVIPVFDPKFQTFCSDSNNHSKPGIVIDFIDTKFISLD